MVESEPLAMVTQRAYGIVESNIVDGDMAHRVITCIISGLFVCIKHSFVVPVVEMVGHIKI